jgi:hypothetical protein
MTPDDIEKLREFGRRMARLTPEQIEAQKWAKWIAELRKREDRLSWEVQQDFLDEGDGLYR